MRLGVIVGRPVIIERDTATDIATASGGLFCSGVMDIYNLWNEFINWHHWVRWQSTDVPTTSGISPTPSLNPDRYSRSN